VCEDLEGKGGSLARTEPLDLEVIQVLRGQGELTVIKETKVPLVILEKEAGMEHQAHLVFRERKDSRA
jgi:hypothetical protein